MEKFKNIVGRRPFLLTAFVLGLSFAQSSLAQEAYEENHSQCNSWGTLMSENGDIQGKDNPAEYTCYDWQRPRPYAMQDMRYNCCSGWVVLRDPKDSWRSSKFDCGTGKKAYNWDKWDVYCD